MNVCCVSLSGQVSEKVEGQRVQYLAVVQNRIHDLLPERIQSSLLLLLSLLVLAHRAHNAGYADEPLSWGNALASAEVRTRVRAWLVKVCPCR